MKKRSELRGLSSGGRGRSSSSEMISANRQNSAEGSSMSERTQELSGLRQGRSLGEGGRRSRTERGRKTEGRTRWEDCDEKKKREKGAGPESQGSLGRRRTLSRKEGSEGQSHTPLDVRMGDAIGSRHVSGEAWSGLGHPTIGAWVRGVLGKNMCWLMGTLVKEGVSMSTSEDQRDRRCPQVSWRGSRWLRWSCSEHEERA